MAVPELSIIVVSYNTRELLAQCLGSLGAAASRTPHEIIVVDNASRDASVEMLGRQFPGATSIAHKEILTRMEEASPGAKHNFLFGFLEKARPAFERVHPAHEPFHLRLVIGGLAGDEDVMPGKGF